MDLIGIKLTPSLTMTENDKVKQLAKNNSVEISRSKTVRNRDGSASTLFMADGGALGMNFLEDVRKADLGRLELISPFEVTNSISH